MSKTLPVARITVAVLEDLAGNAALGGERGDSEARRVPPEAVKAFWAKVRSRVR